MNNKDIIHSIQKEMQIFFTQEHTGHDWYHIERVWKNAKKIAVHYPEANHLQIELAALLHDRYDHKIVDNVEEAKDEVRELLVKYGLTKELIENILYSIDTVGFRNGKNPLQPITIEDKIVQDSDRLDAIGAIAIARTFVYSGANQRPIYTGEPQDVLEKAHDLEDTAIGHFYEKLLTLSDTLHTPEARVIAKGRHEFMKDYLTQFFSEWEGLK
ncbi:HD domain-containing protein [uncultured Granulicatella sp.]|uniref:HD domain-containing protein n=1 Tax=uncultured Granulicatella sp. TaxID=316089 RepID=UPI0028D53BE0|nr:HD domain-containing protein [uncultured Granulicatella sp.]